MVVPFASTRPPSAVAEAAAAVVLAGVVAIMLHAVVEADTVEAEVDMVSWVRGLKTHLLIYIGGGYNDRQGGGGGSKLRTHSLTTHITDFIF